MSKSYYEILEISQTSSAEEIKKAYRKLAFKYHPDTNKEKKTEEIFKVISNAYDVLSNKEKKAKYDIEYKQKIYQEQNQYKHYKTNYRYNTQYNTRQNSNENNDYFPSLSKWYPLVIILFILIIIDFLSSNKKTTTGNKKADFELEQQKRDNRPQSGELQFNK
jgi:curved DNA-binding protein CbpA